MRGDKTVIITMSAGGVAKRTHWDGVSYAIGKSSFSRCALESCHPFVIVRPLSVFSTPPPFLLFIPDYSPFRDTNDARKVHLMFGSDSEASFSFRFDNNEDAKEFVIAVTNAVVLFRKIADADGSHSTPFSLKVEAMWPSGKIENCTIIVCPLTGTFRIDAAAESVKMFLDSIYCAPLVTKVKVFKKTERTEMCFILKDRSDGGLYIFACNSQTEMMQVVLVVHVFNFKEDRKRVINSHSGAEGRKRRESTENEAQEIAFEDIIGEEIETEDFETPNEPEPAPEPAAVEVKKPSSVLFPEKKEKPDSMKKTAIRRPVAGLEPKVEAEKPTFLKDSQRTTGTVPKKFEELEKFISTLRCEAEPVDLPKVSSMSVAVEETMEALPKKSDEDQVLYAMEMLPDPGEDDVKCFNQTTEKNNQQIVEEETAPKPDMPEIDVKQLVKLSDYPEFQFKRYEAASQPLNPIVTEFMNVTQAILEEGGSEYNEVRFAVLVACVLANGMQDKTRFLDAYAEFVKFVPELDKVIEDAREAKTTWAQIARFSCGIINKGLVLLVFRRLKYNVDWIGKYFVNTSLLYSDESIQSIVDLTIPIMMAVQFAVPQNDDMISGGPMNIVIRYLQIPAFSHLSLLRYLKPQYRIDPKMLNRYLSSLLTSHLCKKNCLTSNAEKKWGPAFEYICKAVASHTLYDRDFVEMSEITKTLSNANSSLTLLMNANITALLQGKENALEKWIAAGINARKIHKWFFYIISSPDIAASYFWEESAIRDPYRQRFVLSYLTEIMNHLQ